MHVHTGITSVCAALCVPWCAICLNIRTPVCTCGMHRVAYLHASYVILVCTFKHPIRWYNECDNRSHLIKATILSVIRKMIRYDLIIFCELLLSLRFSKFSPKNEVFRIYIRSLLNRWTFSESAAFPYLGRYCAKGHTIISFNPSVTYLINSAFRIAGCDPKCTSGCESKGIGRCDSACTKGYTLGDDFICAGKMLE